MDVERKVVFQPGVTWERRVGLAMGTQMAIPGDQGHLNKLERAATAGESMQRGKSTTKIGASILKF